MLALRLDRGVQRLDERAVERVVALGAVEQEPRDSGVRVVDEQRHRAPKPRLPTRRTRV